MIGLNIDRFEAETDIPNFWPEPTGEKMQDKTDADRPYTIETSKPESDIFDLARMITYRANTRRRFRRSSSII